MHSIHDPMNGMQLAYGNEHHMFYTNDIYKLGTTTYLPVREMHHIITMLSKPVSCDVNSVNSNFGCRVHQVCQNVRERIASDIIHY